MKTVRLGGPLGDKFGTEFELDVQTPMEAVRALVCNFPSFIKEAEEGQLEYEIWVDGENIPLNRSDHPIGDKRNTIMITPVVGGSYEGALAFAFWIASLSATEFFIFQLAVMAAAYMLAPSPKTKKASERSKEDPSYAYEGPVTTAAQGQAVPIGYGELFVGSQVISAALTTEPL